MIVRFARSNFFILFKCRGVYPCITHQWINYIIQKVISSVKDPIKKYSIDKPRVNNNTANINRAECGLEVQPVSHLVLLLKIYLSNQHRIIPKHMPDRFYPHVKPI